MVPAELRLHRRVVPRPHGQGRSFYAGAREAADVEVSGEIDGSAVKLAFAVVLVTAVSPAAQEPAAGDGWRSLFDGKSLAGWKESDFLGHGKVTVEKGVLTIGSGTLTGITWDGAVPFPA